MEKEYGGCKNVCDRVDVGGHKFMNTQGKKEYKIK